MTKILFKPYLYCKLKKKTLKLERSKDLSSKLKNT